MFLQRVYNPPMGNLPLETESLPPIYEIRRDFFVLEPPLDLEMHSMKEVHKLCTQEYYQHKKGCPNFGKKLGCPPGLKHISEIVDVSTLHFYFLRFHFQKYIEQKMDRSPGWTNRAYANQRHWQAHLRSQLARRWEEVDQYNYPEYNLCLAPDSYCRNPEGHGINVVQTLENHGFKTGWCVANDQDEIVEFPEYMYQVFIFGKELPQIDQP